MFLTDFQFYVDPACVESGDGDWAILEEYTVGNVRTEAYVQGLHGLVKMLTAGIYYYQDELGSTSHIASSTGLLLESYRYDMYGKPTYWSPLNTQLSTSNYGVRDLFGGQRFIAELGLYDDRNRFMSPDQGRFLQPDPIGFKGDSSNLYRYCGNDWANRSDPMGLDSSWQSNSGFRIPDRVPWYQTWNYLMNTTGPNAGLSMAAQHVEAKQTPMPENSLPTVHFDKDVTVNIQHVDVVKDRAGQPVRGAYGMTDALISSKQTGVNSVSVHLTLQTQLLNTKNARLAENAARIETRNRNQLGDFFFGAARNDAQVRAYSQGNAGMRDFVQSRMNDKIRELKINDFTGRNSVYRDQDPVQDKYGY